MNGMPTVRTDDILVDLREGDRIAATEGLGVRIADDLTALEQLVGDVRASVKWIDDLSNASPVYGSCGFPQ